MPVPPGQVKGVISRHMPLSDFGIVVDLARSRGRRIRDAVTGRTYLDLFSFYASAPLGMNHPRVRIPPYVAASKPTNPDVYSTEMAEFVDTFYRVAVPRGFPHLFLVEGGAMAVENALKVAFDWKVRRNLARGHGEKGQQVIHFKEAFHGRSGYTLSLTNTADPRKTQYYPKFAWPRIENPKIRPDLRETLAAERRAVARIEAAFRRHRHDIAAILIEPIQSEGGDNHFRPEFLRALRRLANLHEALLIFDEVQTGIGLTGKMWAFQHFGVVPDLIAFGKKVQVCGVLAGPRVDEVERNVFVEKSRISSTWGGNLTDMVRATRYLEIIAEEGLVENARVLGGHLLGRLQALQAEHPALVSHVRGRGLMCAMDLPSTEFREKLRKALYAAGLLILPCGERSLRFRPPLDVTKAELDEGINLIGRTLPAY
jgi:L-lysine 6-transaminase